jgi:hypothetical protein
LERRTIGQCSLFALAACGEPPAIVHEPVTPAASSAAVLPSSAPMSDEARAAVGSYVTDRDALRAHMANVEHPFPGDRERAMAFVETVDLRLDLGEDGRFVLTLTLPSSGEPASSERGTWKLQGKDLVLESPHDTIECVLELPKIRCFPLMDFDPPVMVQRARPESLNPSGRAR